MQRIQSLFLVIAVALTMSTAVSTIVDINTTAHEIIRISGLKTSNFRIGISHWSHINWILLSISVISMAISAYTITMYAKRKQQMTFCVYGILSQLGIIASLVMLIKPYLLDHSTIKYYVPTAFPAICIILLWLAYRGIKKDDDKIKSVDRIR